jgi:thioredoxin reductase (NADPH)
LPAGEEYLGHGVVHFAPDPATHAGLDVVVVGGGDSAVDWALFELIANPSPSCTGARSSGRTRTRGNDEGVLVMFTDA